MQKLSRHKQRIIALQILYSLDIKNRLNDQSVFLELKALKNNTEAEEIEVKDSYYEKIIKGVITLREGLDQIIRDTAIDWELNRISPLARNILRIALWEMKNGIPEGVAIDEAVELAKEFDSRETASFINGVLGKCSRNFNK